MKLEEIVLFLLKNSINAMWVVMAVVLLRLLLKWAPKRIAHVLWVLPALRLLLPFSLEGEALAMVLRHEHCHLKAGDNIWKLLGYLILSVYWFNPFAWLGYVLFCRDTELACDEKVIEDMELDEKKAIRWHCSLALSGECQPCAVPWRSAR